MGDAAKRMAWTRERGTLKLLIGFVAFLALWFAYGKVRDQQLLSRHWPALSPDPSGLTVVGTLDGRESIGRNMFHIIEANLTSRPELTDFGWNSIFTGTDGPLFSDQAGAAIKQAIKMDSRTGYRMLEPYLRVGVARLSGDPNANAQVSRETPITVGEGSAAHQTTLGALLDKYGAGGGGRDVPESDSSEGGSGSEREVEHGMAIPAETLIRVCPVVVTGAQFTDAWLEEHDEPLLGSKTYTVHLGLTDEGRSRFFQWSHNHLNEHLVFVLNNTVITAGRIKMILDRNDWEIGPLRDRQAAESLVNYINDRRR